MGLGRQVSVHIPTKLNIHMGFQSYITHGCVNALLKDTRTHTKSQFKVLCNF
jgi:hypothetical protein